MGDHSLTNEDLVAIESKMKELSARDVSYEREEISWDKAVDYFKKKGDQYKLELLNEFKNESISMYHQGNFTDLCYGPHIPSTGKIKFIKLMSVAGAYWRGNEKNKMLQRIYGITFPTKQELDEYLFRVEEAKKTGSSEDRRGDGIVPSHAESRQRPSSMDAKGDYRTGSAGKIPPRRTKKRGYLPVVTPHIANLELYKISGHYPYYKDSQFAPITMEDGEQFLLKPMNCPHHHQIYAARPRSYRDLPIRLAEFGTVYRYEQSGEMNGLTRVRGFTQDDAHIYCAHDQLKAGNRQHRRTDAICLPHVRDGSDHAPFFPRR